MPAGSTWETFYSGVLLELDGGGEGKRRRGICRGGREGTVQSFGAMVVLFVREVSSWRRKLVTNFRGNFKER